MITLALWPALLFGAPGMLLSVAVSGLGILARYSWLLVVGAVLSIPSAFYLAGHPGWWILLAGLPLLHLAGFVALRRQQPLLATLFLLPTVAAAVFVLTLTLRNAPV